MRRGQYTLVTFIIAGMILLSLTGIVSDLVSKKADQIAKAQLLTELGDKIRAVKTIQAQERQVGVDFTDIHLGAIAGWPSGLSTCGTYKNENSSWLFKETPYWYSGEATDEFYSYTGTVYAEKTNYITFKISDIRAGLYKLSAQPPFILDGELITAENDKIITDINSVKYLQVSTGNHLFTFDNTDLCKHTLSTCTTGLTTTKPASLRLERHIPKAYEVNNFATGGGYDEINTEPIAYYQLDFGGKIFNGISDELKTPAYLPNGPATISFWIKINENSGSLGKDSHIFKNFLIQKQADNKIYLYNSNAYFNFVPQENQWYHLALTYPSGAGATLYVNGADYPLQGTGTFPTFTNYTSSYTNTLSGTIQDLIFFDETLSEEEITTIYQSAYSAYEFCVPDFEFIKQVYLKFLNTYFKLMTQQAFDQIKAMSSQQGYSLLNFPTVVEYEAVINEFRGNTVLISFYPLNIPLFSINYEGAEAETPVNASATYQGSTIVFDAFQSNFVAYQDIAKDVIAGGRINELINERILGKHSSFNIFASTKVIGSTNEDYEDLMNDKYLKDLPVEEQWRVTDDSVIGTLDFSTLFEGEIKPYCLYYLKEACQFLSDEVPIGLRDTPYFSEATNLFGNFTEDYLERSEISARWLSAKTACQECHDVGELLNPCINISYSPCLQCFEELTGESYTEITSETYGSSAVTGDECKALIDDELKPMLNDYVIYRFQDLEDELNNLYYYGWRLDADKLNVSSITFTGLDSTGAEFKSDCYDCKETRVSNCQALNSDLEITGLSFTTYTEDPDELPYREASYDFNLLDGYIDSENSEKPLNMTITIHNKGATREDVYLTILVDKFYDMPVHSIVPDSTTLISNTAVNYESYTVDKTYKSGDFEVDTFNLEQTYNTNQINIFDYKIKYDYLTTLDGGLSDTITINNSLIPDVLGTNTKNHLMRVCVHTRYNDDADLSNNCVNFVYGVCTDGDIARSCCESEQYGGVWLAVPTLNYGTCCGDDNKPSFCTSQLYAWHFDSFTPTSGYLTTYDTNGANGMMHLGTTADGKYGKALQFSSADSDWADVGFNNFINLKTISFWFKWNGVGTEMTLLHTLWNSISGTGPYAIRLFKETSGTYLRFYAGGYDMLGGISFPVTANEWTHVTLTSIGGGKHVLYKNGVPVYTSSFTGDSEFSYMSLGSSYFSGSGHGSYFNGLIDELKLFTNTFDGLAVKKLYQTSPYACDKASELIVQYADDFLASTDIFCYSGLPYYCPADKPIAAKIRDDIYAKSSDFTNSAYYINYYCVGS